MFVVELRDAPVETWVLRDEVSGAEAEVVPSRGGILSRFRVGETPVVTCDDATLFDSAKNVRGGIPILFPIAGRLTGDRYSWGDQTYELKQHGFARNLPFKVVSRSTSDSASITLALESSHETRKGFPFDFRLQARYRVSRSELTVGLVFENRSSEPMPLHAGFHPYFFVPDGEKGDVRIETRAARAFDNVTKKVGPFLGLDLTKPEIDLHLVDHGSTRSAIDRPGGVRIDVEGSPEMRQWVVWTLAGRDFVCVEPWTAAADALSTRHGLLFVDPGEKRTIGMSVRLIR